MFSNLDSEGPGRMILNYKTKSLSFRAIEVISLSFESRLRNTTETSGDDSCHHLCCHKRQCQHRDQQLLNTHYVPARSHSMAFVFLILFHPYNPS